MAAIAGMPPLLGGVATGDVDEPRTLHRATRWWVTAATVVLFAFTVAQDAPAILASYVTFGFAGYLWARRAGVVAGRLFACVFAGGVLSAMVLYGYYVSAYGTPYWLGGSDELHFEEVGRQFAESYGVLEYGQIRGGLVRVDHNSVAYVYLVGLLFKFAMFFGGVHTMVPRLFNLACLGLIAVGTYRLSLSVGLRGRLPLATGLFAGFLPMMSWVSGQTLRDIVVSALFVALAVVWARPANEQRPRRFAFSLLISGFLIVALIDLRLPQAFVAALVTIAGVLASDAARGRITRWVLLAAAGVLAVMLSYTIAQLVTGQTAFLVGQAVYYSTYRVEDTGGGLSAIVFSTPPPLGWLLRIAYALVTPLPALTSQLDLVWIGLGTVVHVLCLPFFLRGLLAFRLQREWLVIVSAFGFLFLGMALISFQVRHIVQYLPFGIIIAAHGYVLLRGRRHLWTGLMVLAGAFLGTAYAALKLL